MKQKVSIQMDGGLNAQQFAASMNLMGSVQQILYEYVDGLHIGRILEVRQK